VCDVISDMYTADVFCSPNIMHKTMYMYMKTIIYQDVISLNIETEVVSIPILA